jgi:hypothetical protein
MKDLVVNIGILAVQFILEFLELFAIIPEERLRINTVAIWSLRFADTSGLAMRGL